MHAFNRRLRIALAAAIIATLAAAGRAADPHLLRQSETGSGTVAGTWTWDDTRKLYLARWEGGARAEIRVVKFKDGVLELQRTDTNTSLTARYVGTKTGDTVRGTVEWTSGDRTWSGKWEAKQELLAAPARQQRYAPVLVPGEPTEVFNLMAQQKDIAFEYFRDGCYARAHLMAGRMTDLGIRPGKVWAFPPGDEKLTGYPRKHPEGVTWNYHVAPTVRVRQADGRERDLVIDPSMTNRPITVEEWRDMMRTKSGGPPIICRTKLGEAPIDGSGKRCPGTGYTPASDPPDLDAAARRVMQEHFDKLKKGPP